MQAFFFRVQGATRSSLSLGFSFWAGRPGEKGDSAFGGQPPRLDRGRCNRTCTMLFCNDGKCASIFSGCRRFSPAAEFEGAQASCSSYFAFVAAVPPLPLMVPQSGLKCRGATRSSLRSASRSKQCAPGRREIPPSAASLRGWTAAGATAPAPKPFHNFRRDTDFSSFARSFRIFRLIFFLRHVILDQRLIPCGKWKPARFSGRDI